MPTMYLWDTTANAIGSFRDIGTSPAPGGTTGTTGVVNTAASGTNVQWTKTAGGSVLEWITPPIAAGETITSGQTIDVIMYALESSMNANAGGRLRAYRRTAAGVETELSGSPGDDGVEFGTAKALMSWSLTLSATVTFSDNDRLVIRLYITNVGTMASGFTCTLTYAGNSANTADTQVGANGGPDGISPRFKQGTLTRFRFYNDDGAANTATAAAAESTNASVAVDTNIRVRAQIQNIAFGDCAGLNLQLYCSTNGGAYAQVSTAGRIAVTDSANFVSGAASTGRLTAGTGSFDAGLVLDAGNSSQVNLSSADYTEYEWCVRAVSASGASGGDTYDFKIVAGTSGLSYPDIANSVTPRLTLTGSSTMAAGVGSFTLSGQAATLKRTFTPLVAANANFALSGQNAGLKRGLKVVAAFGSFTLSGQAAGLRRSFNPLVAAFGSFALTGKAASLNKGTTLVAAFGSFALSGQTAILKYGRKATASFGSFALSGQTARLARSFNALTAAAGTFVLSGQTAALKVGKKITAALGSFTLTGQAAALKRGLKVIAAVGAITLSGQAATLTLSSAAKVLAAAVGLFAVNGQVATLVKSGVTVALRKFEGLRRSVGRMMR